MVQPSAAGCAPATATDSAARTSVEQDRLSGAAPVDDAWWDSHTPPNGYNCRCRVVSLSDADLHRTGWAKSKRPKVKTHKWKNKRTGETLEIPDGIDPGFGYNPGNAAARRADLERLLSERLKSAFPPRL